MKPIKYVGIEVWQVRVFTLFIILYVGFKLNLWKFYMLHCQSDYLKFVWEPKLWCPWVESMWLNSWKFSNLLITFLWNPILFSKKKKSLYLVWAFYTLVRAPYFFVFEALSQSFFFGKSKFVNQPRRGKARAYPWKPWQTQQDSIPAKGKEKKKAKGKLQIYSTFKHRKGQKGTLQTSKSLWFAIDWSTLHHPHMQAQILSIICSWTICQFTPVPLKLRLFLTLSPLGWETVAEKANL